MTRVDVACGSCRGSGLRVGVERRGRTKVSREAVHALHDLPRVAHRRRAAERVRAIAVASRAVDDRRADAVARRHGQDPKPGEESFLWGAFGESLGPVQLGIEMRPSYLHYSFLGTSQDRNLLMNADVHRGVQGEGLAVLRTGRPRARTGRPHA